MRGARAIGAAAVSALSVLGFGLSGCTAEPPPESAPESAPGVIVPGRPGEPASVVPGERANAQRQPVRVSDADVRYMRMMIPHHEQAITMTDLVAERASSEQVRTIAERIAVAQDGEITAMRAWLDQHAPEHGGHEEHGEEEHGEHEEHGGHERMPGMATPEQLDALRAARGAEFDRLFLRLMIVHHEGALTMAEDYLPHGVEPTALAMAQDVIGTQTAEIEHMREMSRA